MLARVVEGKEEPAGEIWVKHLFLSILATWVVDMGDKFTTGINDTGGTFATGVNDTDGI